MLFERETAGVQIARHDGSNFQKGLVTIRATERIALVITNSTAMVTGSL
ncbi:MAG: phage major capsid protein [Gammaproteobacteria bacterium]|nr:phage major capsid protein [Gammaproteobacteria bacterium]